jgi:hypothetical protein
VALDNLKMTWNELTKTKAVVEEMSAKLNGKILEMIKIVNRR